MIQRLLAPLMAVWLFASVADAAEYRVGVFLPLSGANAEKGVPLKNAIELWADKLNAAGGIKGHKLALDFRDDANDPDKARQAAAALAADPNVLAVIGTYYASTALGAVQVLGDAKTVCLFPTVGSPEVINANPYMF